MTPAPGTSLRRNLRWVLAGNLVYAACQWAMLVALARLGTPEMVGDFALALALTAPLFVLATLNLRAAQATDQCRAFAFSDYVQLRLICVAAAALVLAIVLVVGGFGGATVATVALVGATKSFDALSDVVYGLLQQHERMRRIGVSRILQGTLQVVGLTAAMLLTGSVVAAAAAMAVVSLGVTLFYDVRSVGLVAAHVAAGESLRVWRRPRWATLCRLLLLALPLGIAASLDALNASVPRFVLDAQGSRAALGYYAAIAYFLIGQGTVLVALADAARPRLARAYLESRDEFHKLAWRLALVAVGASTFGVLLARVAGAEILGLLYGREYATQAAVFVWIMAAAIPWNLAGVLGTALAATRHFGALSLSFVVMTGVTTVASFLLVPDHGALGAAWALGLGMLARLATCGFSLWYVLRSDALPVAALGANAS